MRGVFSSWDTEPRNWSFSFVSSCFCVMFVARNTNPHGWLFWKYWVQDICSGMVVLFLVL